MAFADEPGTGFVDVGKAPVTACGDQREDRISGLDHGSEFLVTLDHDGIVGCNECAVPQQCLFELNLCLGIGQLCASADDFTFGNDNIGFRHRLVPHGLLRHLLRDDVAANERLLAIVCLLLLGEHRAGLLQVGLCPGDVDRSDFNCGVGLGYLGLLLTLAETRKDLTFRHAVAMVGMKLGQRRADLEPNLRQHARFHGAEAEDADGHTLLSGRYADGNGAISQKCICGKSECHDTYGDEHGAPQPLVPQDWKLPIHSCLSPDCCLPCLQSDEDNRRDNGSFGPSARGRQPW